MLQAILLDLDGVVYRGPHAVPGAVEFIHNARQRGQRIMFITNRSGRSPLSISRHLFDLGIRCEPEDIITSAAAAVHYLKTRKTPSVFAIGGEGLIEAIAAGGIIFSALAPSFVVVGGDPKINFAKITTAVRLILSGAKLIATNSDRLVDTADGLVPANGAIVAAISYATQTHAIVVGKPQPLMVNLALDRIGVRREDALLVGDNP